MILLKTAVLSAALVIALAITSMVSPSVEASETCEDVSLTSMDSAERDFAESGLVSEAFHVRLIFRCQSADGNDVGTYQKWFRGGIFLYGGLHS